MVRKIMNSSIKTLHGCFEKVVVEHPNKTAITYAGNKITYDMLNSRSNQIASYLVANGMQREDKVALLVDLSNESIALMLATLKAGGAYIHLHIFQAYFNKQILDSLL